MCLLFLPYGEARQEWRSAARNDKTQVLISLLELVCDLRWLPPSLGCVAILRLRV